MNIPYITHHLTQQRMVGHVDINSYFATLLQQENPHLRGKPIGVIKGEGRTCIIAASKEAKARGVLTGTRLKEARQRCPEIIPVPVDFDRCLDATYRLKRIFHTLAPQVDVYSLDEAFLEIGECLPHIYPTVGEATRLIGKAIKDELGSWVTCSIGIARTRFLAKMASDQAPNDGSLILGDQSAEDELLARVGFESVCGIGFRLGAKLMRMGVTRPYQLRFLSHADLVPVVGEFWASQLQLMAYGDEPHLLRLVDRHLPHMKTVSRSITGYRTHISREEIESILINLIEEVTHKIRRMDLVGRQVWVSLRGSDEERYARYLTLSTPVRTTREVWAVVGSLLADFWLERFPVIKCAVRIGLLRPWLPQARSLFAEIDDTQPKISESLTSAVDTLNEKYGLFTVRPGSLLKRAIIKPEVTGYLGDRQYYGL